MSGEDDKQYIYVSLVSKRPVNIREKGPQQDALRVALLDFQNALSTIAYSRHANGRQHIIFYDDPRFILGGSSSDRIRSAVIGIGVASERNKAAIEVQDRIRPVSGMSIRAELKRLDSGSTGLLEQFIRENSLDGQVQNTRNKLRARTAVSVSGPIEPMIRLDRRVHDHKLTNYNVDFYS